MISSSFLTDISNFEEFSSFHSDEPLTSTPIKISDEREQTSTPLQPSFVCTDESSIVDSVGENDLSRLADSDADTISTPTSKSRLVVSNSFTETTNSVSTQIAASTKDANHASTETTETVNSASTHIRSDAAKSVNNDSSLCQWFGYKVVGDNVDKKVKPRYMRSDNQSKDLHYFHLYALRDRVDLSRASEDPPNLNPDPELAELIPADDDIKEITSNFGVLIARQLIQYFPYFEKHFADVVQQHIPHTHEAEMEQISKVVSHCIE